MNNREYLDTKVTRINDKFHIRLINTDTNKVLDEMACMERMDIGYCIREMMRWHDKMGGTSPMADSSRHRLGKNFIKTGKIEYENNLQTG